MASRPRRQPFAATNLDGVTVVRFSDPILDEDHRLVIEEQVFGLAEGADPKHLRLDLAGVRFVSSAALGAFVALHRKLQAVGGRLSLCNLNPEMEEVIRATKLDSLLDIRRD